MTDGPKVKTKYYDYWLQNYERVDKSIQAVLLAGDYDSEKQTDGTVPWADSFSIYRLLMKNGNSVVHYLIKAKIHHMLKCLIINKQSIILKCSFMSKKNVKKF